MNASRGNHREKRVNKLVLTIWRHDVLKCLARSILEFSKKTHNKSRWFPNLWPSQVLVEAENRL
jgi:hypothetical protein